MCNNCFQSEIDKFETAKQWEMFDLELSNRLGQGKLRQVKVVNKIRKYGEEETFYVYQCSTCQQKWKLEEPGDHSDGHFIKFSAFQQLAKTQLKNRQVIALAIGGTIIYGIIRAIFW